ncbi:hypothetical protein SAY87_024970 [Trapa incisa]|uniref:PPIase cyclophilin-type domain-containing protein n=1 Tax=Trapa incisa TaxID=236973 RepID=A0AAN7JFU1_9MYRT|nr:hypothetical protein SAY87_024970 [Trapa incisa]
MFDKSIECDIILKPFLSRVDYKTTNQRNEVLGATNQDHVGCHRFSCLTYENFVATMEIGVSSGSKKRKWITIPVILASLRLDPWIDQTMRRSLDAASATIWLALLVILASALGVLSEEPELGSARVVFQTNYGDIEFGFYPNVAPKTVNHIFKLVRLGCYNTNHFFRVDRGFVAQVADVAGGRSAPMNENQRVEAKKTIVGEFSNVKHVRGILSMGRYDDPDSAQSSFSILLGNAPHLDGKYAIFGKVTKGDETLKKLEELPTRREGIFVMPQERITILSSYYYAAMCPDRKIAYAIPGDICLLPLGDALIEVALVQNFGNSINCSSISQP